MFIKDIINAITAPYFLITAAAILLLVSLKYPDKFYTSKSGAIVFACMFGFLGISVLDPNFRLIVTKPDNVPIVGMLFLVPFFTWFALREAVRNDQRIAEGKTTKERSELIGVSVRTGESHRARIMEKLHIHETASLVRYAIRQGFIEP